MLLKDYVPFFICKIKEFDKIYGSQQQEIDKLNLDIDDLKNQCFVWTATWGLTLWEDFVGIDKNSSRGLEERRSRILAKLRGQGTTTKGLIKNICESFVAEADIVEHNENYCFEMILKSKLGFPYELISLYESIDEVKPAHLNTKYTLVSTVEANFYLAATTVCGEEIVVYPWSPKGIESKGKVNIAMAQSSGVENITIYPK